MITFEKKGFKLAASRIKRAGGTIRDGVQLMIEMGLDFYREHEDTCYLTIAMEVAQETRSVPANKLKEYINEHANVKWIASKEDADRFKKDGDSAVVTEPTQTWWEYAQADKVVPDMDVQAKVAVFLRSIEKNIDEGKIKEGQEEYALSMVATLKAA